MGLEGWRAGGLELVLLTHSGVSDSPQSSRTRRPQDEAAGTLQGMGRLCKAQQHALHELRCDVQVRPVLGGLQMYAAPPLHVALHYEAKSALTTQQASIALSMSMASMQLI